MFSVFTFVPEEKEKVEGDCDVSVCGKVVERYVKRVKPPCQVQSIEENESSLEFLLVRNLLGFLLSSGHVLRLLSRFLYHPGYNNLEPLPESMLISKIIFLEAGLDPSI